MTITLDPHTGACLRAIAQRRHLSVEAYLTEIIALDAQHLSDIDRAGTTAELVRNGHYLAISSPLPPGWDPVKAIEEMRAERDHRVLGL